jgi:hypothetical protein
LRKERFQMCSGGGHGSSLDEFSAIKHRQACLTFPI